MGSARGAEDVTANVTWEAGKSQKLYAATIGHSVTVDFDNLGELLGSLNKFIAAVNGEFATNKATMLRFSDKYGLSMSSYRFVDSKGVEQKSLYGKAKENNIFNGSSTEPLLNLRDLLVKAREKLISLGAGSTGKRH